MTGSTSTAFITHTKISSKTKSFAGLSTSQVDDEALQFHWKTFPVSAKQFILSTLDNLSLQKLVDFWSTHTEYTSGSVAGGIYGASWYLALVYLNRGEVSKARALTLNGCFLQECYYSSLERIAYLCTCKTIGEYDLPHFYVGFQATRSTQAMYNFLQRSMPQEYQQMLASFVNMGTKSRVMNFVGNVSNDWASTSSKGSLKKSLRANNDDGKINLIIGDESYQVGTSTPLKTLFNEYADKNSVCLKSLRFSFAGKTLFLSTAGRKTPTELGMLDNDTIEVQSNQEPESKEEEKPSPQKPKGSGAKKQKKGSKKARGKNKKGCSKIEVSSSTDDYKVEHSKALTKLFEEAEPTFKLIRQELNSMNLLKQQPKTKTHSKEITSSSFSEFSPTSNGLGGKAGKTRFLVNVGEVSNLYKSSKSLNQPTTVSTIDLHGCTREEAVTRLNAGLKEWNDRAMLGSYPFIHSVSIVCGGGSQVLSETVEKWIGEKKNVSNAPKGSICKSRFGAAA